MDDLDARVEQLVSKVMALPPQRRQQVMGQMWQDGMKHALKNGYAARFVAEVGPLPKQGKVINLAERRRQKAGAL